MLDILKIAAKLGGLELLRYFQKEKLHIQHKTGHNNIVTAADYAAQKVIIESIYTQLALRNISASEVGIIGEEELFDSNTHTFVIDPLDGTSNFAAGHNYFAVLIAYFFEGILQSGVIYKPCTDEMYYAQKGGGACMQKGKQVKKIVLPKQNCKEMFLGTYADMDPDENLPLMRTLIPHFRGLRILGSCALDSIGLAQGTFGLLYYTGGHIWDFASARVILNEVGAEVYALDGTPLRFSLKKDRQYPCYIFSKQNSSEIDTFIRWKKKKV